MSKTVKIVLAVGIVVVLVGGAGVWYFAIRDTAAKTASLDAIGGTTNDTGPAKASADGAWKVQPGTDVFAGYRMQELFGGQTIKRTATGHSADVTGTMTVAGATIPATDITVNVTALKSDEDRRDAAVRSKGLETDKIGTATFKLTKPIALPSAPKQGEAVNVTATGDLTLHGVTKSVEVPLTASWTGNTIKVATTGDGLPISLADYSISTIEIPGFVSTDDHGSLELQLLFVPA